jgi:hypothetical protein
LVLCALALTVPGWTAGRADSPTPAPVTGRLLLLENEHTLEGTIERQGDQYRVRRSVGELWIPSDQVLHLCNNYAEAYTFLRSRANLRDADEHLRLAHWCQMHGLRPQALQEAREAVALRPEHAESRRLLRNLERLVTSPPTAAAAHSVDEPDGNLPPPPVDNESLSIFITRVQPILMNACANCHATGRGGDFKLVRTYDHSLTNRRSALQNLTAVLAQVNKDRPTTSRLLVKAVSVHGEMAQPVFKSHETSACRTLEEWVRSTVEHNPQLRDGSPAPAPATVVSTGTRPTVEFASAKTESKPAEPAPQKPSAPVAPAPPPAPVKPTEAATPTLTEPVDAYDPAIFNQQAHPSKKVETGKQ